MLNETEIIRKVLGGDIGAFELLIRRYNALLYKIGRSYGFLHHDVEDLMQDTHVAAYQALPGFRQIASYKTWIARIMVNKCLHNLKYGYRQKQASLPHNKESIQQSSMKPNEHPEKNLLNKELALILESSLQQLPLIYRSVFLLRQVEGFSTSETADLLAISETNVKVRLNRAKALLQEQIEQFYSQPEIYAFNFIYCDAIVHRVFQQIQSGNNDPDETRK